MSAGREIEAVVREARGEVESARIALAAPTPAALERAAGHLGTAVQLMRDLPSAASPASLPATLRPALAGFQRELRRVASLLENAAAFRVTVLSPAASGYTSGGALAAAKPLRFLSLEG